MRHELVVERETTRTELHERTPLVRRQIRGQHASLTASESFIRDTNIAAETSNFTRNQIMVQASTAVLAQANVISQNVLQLLG